MNLEPRDVLEFLSRPVDVRRLIQRLAFDLDNFDQANMEQPRLSLEAGRYRTQAALMKARLELQLETKQAELGNVLRRRGQDAKKAPTDKAVQGKVILDPEVQSLRKRLYLAEATEVWAKQLAEAYQYQRLAVLKNIGEVRASEISNEIRTVKGRAAVDGLRRQAEKMRKRYDREDE
jgi:hypothetical protein